MKPFDDLSRTTQFRRLKSLACRALLDYNLDDVSLTPLQYIQNAIWKVQCRRSGQQYVLRIHAPRRHDTAAIRSELHWLEALHTEGGFVVPTPIRTRNERLWTTVSAPGVSQPRVCTLLNWVPGRLARRKRTPAILREMGRLMARLHQQASRYRIAKSFVRPRWDHRGLFGREETTQLGWDRLTKQQERLFEAVAERMHGVMERLGADRDVFGLIHGDLIFENVMFHRGEARPIDFDDCGFGYFLYDTAILLDRIEMRDDYTALRAALLEGYRSIRSLSAQQEEHLNLFVLARWVYLGVCFLSRPEFGAYAPPFLAIVEPKIERYLRAAKTA